MAGFGVNVEPWNFRVPLIPPGRRRKDLPRKPACYVYGRQHYYAVKMRANRSLKDNPERIAAVHTVFSESGTVALETGSDWSADIANEFLDTCNMRLMWVEDPAPHSDLHLVRDHPLNTITDGEKAVYASELYELFTRGKLRKLIIDVQYIGGPVRFFQAARVINALGATVAPIASRTSRSTCCQLFRAACRLRCSTGLIRCFTRWRGLIPRDACRSRDRAFTLI